MRFIRNKTLALLTMLAVVFSTAAISPVYAADTPQEGDTTTFQVLFTSDTHGSFLNHNYATGKDTKGSLAQVSTIIKREKEAFDGKTFIVDVGDTIQGNGTSLFIGNEEYDAFPSITAFNIIGYDIFVPGNHEFNFGIPNLKLAADSFNGDKLCGNVKDENGNLMEGYEAYTIKTLDSGLRVAFIGMVTPNIDLWDTANMNNAGFKTYSASDETRKIIDKLQAADLADVFIATQHMGNTSEYGREGSGALDVAAKNPELAVFLGAHYHTITGTKDNQVVLEDNVKFVENKNAAESVGKILITATYEGGKWVIKDKISDYETSDVKTDVIAIDESVALDPAVVAALKGANDAADNYITKTVIGKLAGGPLVPEPEIQGTYEGYLQDTALTDLINNVMFQYSNADISGTAPLDANANCQPGEITIGGVVQIYKYDNNTLYKLNMTGAQVVKWMEWSYSYFGSTIDGNYDHTKPAVNLNTDLTIPTGTMQGYNQDQFAGIIYEVDLTKPVGERINVISMQDGTPFEPDKSYVVAANNYRSSTQLLTTSPTGVFKPGEETAALIAADLQESNGLTSMMDLIIDYIRLQPNGEITNTCDNNWKFVNLDWDLELRAEAIRLVNEGKITTDFKTPVTKEQVKAILANEPSASTEEPEGPVPTSIAVEESADTIPTDTTEATLEATPVPEELSLSNTTIVYIVKDGDSLFKIAQKCFSDGNQWRKIYEANNDQIKDPSLIYIGQELNIPTL